MSTHFLIPNKDNEKTIISIQIVNERSKIFPLEEGDSCCRFYILKLVKN